MCSVATQKRSREEVGLAKLREENLQQQIAKLTDLNAANNTRLEKQAAEVQAKAQAAREKLDEQRKKRNR